MPVFLASALAMLAATFGKKLLTRGAAAAVAGGAATSLVLDDAGGLLPNPFGFLGGGGTTRRRRRRRALTASDRGDIAFIEATLGKAAGKSFAMIIASRAS